MTNDEINMNTQINESLETSPQRYGVRADQSSVPLATFQMEGWADRWRWENCRTGLVYDAVERRFCEPKLPHDIAPNDRLKCDMCQSKIEWPLKEPWDGGYLYCEGCA